MINRFSKGPKKSLIESNIYADKSSLVLDWLLKVGIKKKHFSLREVAREQHISVGLVQKVFQQLVFKGLLYTKGLRTSKTFEIRQPIKLLKNWIENYNVVKKCTIWTYQTGFQEPIQALKAIKKNKLQQKVALTLHSAAEAYGCKNTNLQTLELYLCEPDSRPLLEEAMELAPQERGYEVLLIEPYYKSILKSPRKIKDFYVSPPLLTYLDLYHFPLRGYEQAEYLKERIPELKQIKKKVE